MPSKKTSKQYSTTTIYFKKHESYFIETCKKYSSERFPKMSFSEFIVMCIKDYVNQLSLEERKSFEECAWQLVEKEKPKASAYVDKFLKKETYERLSKRKERIKQNEPKTNP